MGYRIAVLDPDPDCPAAAVADRLVIGSYDDVGAALRLADLSDVVTYELEHVAADVVEAIEARVPVRPGHGPLIVTQDRLAERRFVEAAGVAVAPWREVRSVADARAAADELGLPLRLKLPIGGYDGRGQLRITTSGELDDAWERLGRPPGAPLLAERELDFACRAVRGRRTRSRWRRGGLPGRPERPRRRGSSSNRWRPRRWRPDVAARAVEIGTTLAEAMDLCGTLTAELFLLRDGSLVVNELAPRVHNSGHWTIEGAATSQFEQHIRAICGLGLGSDRGARPDRDGQPPGHRSIAVTRAWCGVADALADPTVHLHLYDKRRVFERRKMGHLTALGPDVDAALTAARGALAALRWADDETEEGDR